MNYTQIQKLTEEMNKWARIALHNSDMREQCDGRIGELIGELGELIYKQ